VRLCTRFACLAAALFVGSAAIPQQGRPTETPGKLEIAKHPLVLERPVGPAAQSLDLAKLHAEADELVKLAQSVTTDVNQVVQGKLPKDMADNLRRIEKLSKHIRGELVH
jgi:hypothetical protein